MELGKTIVAIRMNKYLKTNLKNRIPSKVLTFFTTGHQRSVKAKKNIFASFGLKGISMLISFLLVPLTLNYLDPTRYGLWLTISSVIGWFGFFDIGLGNGLRNKLSEALTLKDYKLSKTYISTTYAILSLIIVGVFIVFIIVNPFLNWAKLLNTPPEMANELSRIVLIVFAFFTLRFILKLIGIVLTADQMPAVNNSFTPLGDIIALIAIFFATKYSQGNLLYVSVIYSAAPVIVLIIASFYFYNGKYRSIRPSIKSVDFHYFKSLAGLGVKFFILQISCLVIFATDNMIITQLLGPAEVTPYNIAFKYFGIPIMVFTIILTPFWSAYTEAITKNDISWIKSTVRKLVKIWFIMVIGVGLMLIVAKPFYRVWVGDKVHIPFMLSAFMGLYAIISTWNNIFAYFINGVGKIKLQMYYGIIAMIINIPISIFFAKTLNMGSAGVILGTCASLIIGSFFAPIQSWKIIKGNAKGIWNK